MCRLELVKRNVQEIVTEEELEELLNKKENPCAYVGYEPSGKIHLGHVLTVNKLIDLQKAGFNVIVLLADVHAYLNRKGTFEEVRKIADYNRRCFVALGLDEKKTNFVYGSDYQFGAEYMLNVLKLSRAVTLNRARRSMDEVGRAMDDPTVSQMVYPLMQAVDIAMLKVDVAVGGIDQRKIHMLARENLKSIEFKTPVCIHTPILIGLDGTKMSSSKDNFISVEDTREEIHRKFKKAYCKIGDLENNPTLAILRYHIFPRYETVVIERPQKFGGNLIYTNYYEIENDFVAENVHPMDLKNAAAKYIDQILESVRNVLL